MVRELFSKTYWYVVSSCATSTIIAHGSSLSVLAGHGSCSTHFFQLAPLPPPAPPSPPSFFHQPQVSRPLLPTAHTPFCKQTSPAQSMPSFSCTYRLSSMVAGAIFEVQALIIYLEWFLRLLFSHLSTLPSSNTLPAGLPLWSKISCHRAVIFDPKILLHQRIWKKCPPRRVRMITVRLSDRWQHIVGEGRKGFNIKWSTVFFCNSEGGRGRRGGGERYEKGKREWGRGGEEKGAMHKVVGLGRDSAELHQRTVPVMRALPRNKPIVCPYRGSKDANTIIPKVKPPVSKSVSNFHKVHSYTFCKI